MKNPTNWLIANNISKREVALFKSTEKYTNFLWKLQRNWKGLYPSNLVNYLGIKINEKVIWKQQISDLAIKLNRQNFILSKLMQFIDRKALKSIYHAKPFF